MPINLAISLFTVAAAIPTRLIALSQIDLTPFLAKTIAIAVGAVVAAYLGVGWLRRMSGPTLGRLIFGLMIVLGIGMVAEAWIELISDGFLPSPLWVRLLAGLAFGFGIGAISSILGVAGGEVIIPTLVFAWRADQGGRLPVHADLAADRADGDRALCEGRCLSRQVSLD